MNTEWILQNNNWYEGAAKKSPSTNNALEAFNRVIKDCGTLRQRFPLSQFLTIASKLVSDWSVEYQSGVKVFKPTVTITLEHFTSGYQWVKQYKDKKITSNRNEGEFKVYQIPAKVLLEVPTFVEKWTTFEEFRSQHFSSYEVLMPINTDKWADDGSCTCPQFFKKRMCKHLVGLAIRLDLTTVPQAARNLPISQKRKRGRPQLSKKALIT